MRSLMVQRFARYAVACRVAGIFFIHNFPGKPLAQAKATWKSLYTFYSSSCFAVYVLVEMALVQRYLEALGDISHSFSRSLLLMVYALISARLTANVATMITGPGKLLAFFRQSEAFEKTSLCSLPRALNLQASSTHRWAAIRAFLVILAIALCYAFGMHFLFGQLSRSLDSRGALPLRIVGFFVLAAVVLYDSTLYFSLRISAKVFAEYIRSQREAFETCRRSRDIYVQSRVTQQIESIRLNLSKIGKLKDSMNDIWAVSLVVDCATIVGMDCIMLDAVFHDGLNKELWWTLAYSLFASLCFIDLAYLSQTLVDEARKFKNATLAVPVLNAKDDLVQQLRYLHETIEPEAMCFGGGGFFALNNSLLVSMTGSIIIYAVILVQTSDTMAIKIDSI